MAMSDYCGSEDVLVFNLMRTFKGPNVFATKQTILLVRDLFQRGEDSLFLKIYVLLKT